MSNLTPKSIMENLINKKFYADKETAMSKLNVFFAVNEITEQDYTDLVLLLNNVYIELQEVQENEQMESFL